MWKALLRAGIAGLLVVGHPALAQIDLEAMTTMDGRCHAEIEAKAGACQPVGTLFEFGNGRSLFLFAEAGTLYSFSGSTLAMRGADDLVLTVGVVRITSQSAPEREFVDAAGECVAKFTADRRSFATVECDARSPAANARYRFRLDQISNLNRQEFK